MKIEAIECFPCYMKFSFFYHDDAVKELPFAVIRINIPGVQVEGAASRTKSLAYGVFWKNNRKRCKLFFGFERNGLFQQHIEWLRAAIDSLEDYRKSKWRAICGSNSVLIRTRISRHFENPPRRPRSLDRRA